jgi:hypothetical protein
LLLWFDWSPKCSNKDVTRHEIIVKPFYCLRHLQRNFWQYGEEEFKGYLDELKPDGKKIIDVLVKSAGDAEGMPHEDRVFDFLKRFFNGLSSLHCERFLKFVTSQEVLTTNTVILVQFNGNTNPEMMIPLSFTCGNVFRISKYFFTYDHLEKTMYDLLNSPAAWNFFSVI